MANIICFGDSLVLGYYDEGGGWPNRLRSLLEKKRNIKHKNVELPYDNISTCGIRRATFHNTYARLGEIERRLSTEEKNIVILSLGSNDSAVLDFNEKTQKGTEIRSVVNFSEEVLAMILAIKGISESKKAHTEVFCLGLKPCVEKLTSPSFKNPDHYYSNQRLEMFSNNIKISCDSTTSNLIFHWD